MSSESDDKVLGPEGFTSTLTTVTSLGRRTLRWKRELTAKWLGPRCGKAQEIELQ